MTISDWILIGATCAGVATSPFIAVFANASLERRRAAKERKLTIFKTLMATRVYQTLSYEHVLALNMIDMEFGKDAKFKNVIEAWKIYRDHLYDKEFVDRDAERWRDESTNRLIKLLKEMAISLNYEFDEVILKRGIYSPQGHGEVEFDLYQISSLVSLLSGERPLPIIISSQPEGEIGEEQRKLGELIKEYLSKEIPIRVVIVDKEQD